MPEPDYEDPATEERWCADMREQVVTYLAGEHVSHGEVGEWPAWHLAPYVSVWAIESKAKPGWVGWWVVCGDLPTDYVSAESIKHPRHALQEIASRWQRYVEGVRGGAAPDDLTIAGIADNSSELLPMLESRAATLSQWAGDDELWQDL
jgi:hypothetical protein